MQGSRVRRCKTDRVTRQVSLGETRQQIENDSTNPCWCATMVDCFVSHEWDIWNRFDDDKALGHCSTVGRSQPSHPTVHAD